MRISEPSLIMFSGNDGDFQRFVVAEGDALFEIDNFSIVEGLLSLIAAYYVFHISYPKSSPATGVLFVQEVLMEMGSKPRKPQNMRN